MRLRNMLAEKKDEIVRQWVAAVNGTYPFGTVGFLRTQNDPFINPVGRRTREAAEVFTAALISGERDAELLSQAMDDFIQVRAVQDFPAETAVGIIYAFKQIIREQLGGQLAQSWGKEPLFELLEVEADIDALALMAFGAYARQREKLANLRVEEFKRGHSQIIRQAERVLGRSFPEHRPGKI